MGRPPRVEHVAIVGAGFSGTLLAINLLRHGGPRAKLIEARDQVGCGVAYSAADDEHLLNARAGRMSALPDDDGHFARWLQARGGGHADFARRVDYGRYLRELLDEARAAHPDRLQLVEGRAVDVEPDGVRLADGRLVRADAAVLAVGNLPPHPPPGLVPEALPPGVYRGDPWAGDVAEGLGPDDAVLLIGTGLTMVDAALLLGARGFRGRMVALSRRGLLPRVHAAEAPERGPVERPPPRAGALLRAVRRRGAEVGWRTAVNELRPHTQALWRAASPDEQRRFLRHLRPWWDVHRHRLAPDVGAKLDALRAAGRLEATAGRLLGAEALDRRALVRWRPRGGTGERTLEAARVVNCTGPQGDLSRADDPLLHRLLARGLIRPDRHRIGIDVDAQSAAVGADGVGSPTLLAIGPMTRGCFWEIVAVPDIRVQAWSVARRLSNAHWVEGHGL